jgi:hypothetical protein
MPVLAGGETCLAQNGKALFPIVVNLGADKEVLQAAADLADYLGRISGAVFVVTNGDGLTGIAVGTISDFPALHLDYPVKTEEPSRREDYLLQSHRKGVYLVGQTPVAARHAVWDLLHHLGYRQFFPGKHWEIIPDLPVMRIRVDSREHPSFYARTFFYGGGEWRGLYPDKLRWEVKNRGGSAWPVNSTSHIYDGIIKSRKKEFDQHPEYFCSTNRSKFRVSNPELRKLVVGWALEYLEKNPKLEVVSMEPSDGGGWENKDEEQVFNSVSDRVVTLANEVAEAVEKKYGKAKCVGFYAYSSHSTAPSIRVHSNIVVGVATMFNSSGMEPEDCMAAWSRQGATIGVRDYWNVTVWDQDLPALEPASDLFGVVNRYKKYHAAGVRFCLAESSNSWGPMGLPVYCLVRTMWNVNEDAKGMVDDFFEKAFGPAEKPMREFYAYLDRANRNTIAIFSRQQIGSMYRALDKAYRATNDAGIRGRLDDLALYTRYAEMMFDYRLIRYSEKTLDNTRAVMEFMYRIRDRHMVHSLGMWRDTRGFYMPSDRKGLDWDLPEGQHPWKNTTPFDAREIESMVQAGISNNSVIPFVPKSYSEDLRPPPASMGLVSGKRGAYSFKRNTVPAFAWFEKPGRLDMQLTSGMIGDGRNPTAVTGLKLYDATNALVSASPLVLTDAKPHEVAVTSSATGLHKLEITEGRRGVKLTWEPRIPVSFPVKGEAFNFVDMCFYVPKGITEVAGYAAGLTIHDGDGNLAFELKGGAPGYFCIPVKPGQDGRVWRASGKELILMTVPPFVACSASELLLPKEVITADGAK